MNLLNFKVILEIRQTINFIINYKADYIINTSTVMHLILFIHQRHFFHVHNKELLLYSSSTTHEEDKTNVWEKRDAKRSRVIELFIRAQFILSMLAHKTYEYITNVYYDSHFFTILHLTQHCFILLNSNLKIHISYTYIQYILRLNKGNIVQ